MTPPEKIRKQLGLSQVKMAALMGVHPMTWSKWERGVHPPTSAAEQSMLNLLWLHGYNKATFKALLKHRALDK